MEKKGKGERVCLRKRERSGKRVVIMVATMVSGPIEREEKVQVVINKKKRRKDKRTEEKKKQREKEQRL